MYRTAAAVALVVGAASVISCTSSNVNGFLSSVTGGASTFALTNVRVIDGTGSPAKDAQTIVVDGDRISAIGGAGSVAVPPGAKTIDLSGRTVTPGLIGVHNHLFYHAGGGEQTVQASESFALLYLAAGVTTIRTAGAVDFDDDLRIKRLIDEGKRPGPTIHVTGPYLHAQTPAPDPERVARDVTAWADKGATSFKAYMTLRRDELKAAIDTAHARGLKVTGHLCAVGFIEAASLGIDNVEHGLLADTEYASGKQPDVCPESGDFLGPIQALDITGPLAAQTISALVRRNVSVTSTLAAYETFISRAQLDARTPGVLSPWAADVYRSAQAERARNDTHDRGWTRLLDQEMKFERAFVEAGGRLVAGVDPTGWGGLVAGFGDQRQLELLVNAGFTPEMAIRIASANGAALLNESQVGYLAPGMQADLVVVRGNPAGNIADIRNVEVVFKKGVGYDPDALIAAAQGTVGARDYLRGFRRPIALLIPVMIVLLIARRVWRNSRPA